MLKEAEQRGERVCNEEEGRGRKKEEEGEEEEEREGRKVELGRGALELPTRTKSSSLGPGTLTGDFGGVLLRGIEGHSRES